MAARVFFGQGGGGAIYAAGESALDGGNAFDARARTARIAPAGASGECIFPAVWVVLTWTMPVTVRVTALVDGVEVTSAEIVLPSQATRVTERREIGLSIRLVDAHLNIEVARFSPRGTWLQVEVKTTPVLADGELIFEGIEAEFEVVSESAAALVSTP